jgi:N-acetylglucosamine repressor
MSLISRVQPSLLGKMNERQVLRVLQAHGPLSRAEVARHSGLSAPTVSKAVASLLRAGLLEEGETPEQTGGRPATKLRLANEKAQVLGIAVDAGACRVVSAGLDGLPNEDAAVTLATPPTYPKLLAALADVARELMDRPGVTTLGVGLSMPGLIDYRQKRVLLSPNVPQTNGHTPGLDLARQLGVECVMLQESHALCLAERHYGHARGLDDFAMLDVSTGVGLSAMSGGRLLTGHSGLAGEVGHVTVVPDGRPCGCGNRGCLETVASDSSLAWRVSQRLGRPLDIDAVLGRVRAGELDVREDLLDTCGYLAVGVAAVINLFNPSTLFIHGRMFEADPLLFERLVGLAGQRALPPSFRDCRVVQARGRKGLGAVAGIVEHLTRSIAPTLEAGFVA